MWNTTQEFEGICHPQKNETEHYGDWAMTYKLHCQINGTDAGRINHMLEHPAPEDTDLKGWLAKVKKDYPVGGIDEYWNRRIWHWLSPPILTWENILAYPHSIANGLQAYVDEFWPSWLPPPPFRYNTEFTRGEGFTGRLRDDTSRQPLEQ